MRDFTNLTRQAKQATAQRAWQNYLASNQFILRSNQIERSDRECLEERGLLTKIVKGWHIVFPSANESEKIAIWKSSFWIFCREYLNDRFGEDWCLSADNSLLLHVGNWKIPDHAVVVARGATNRFVRLLYDSTLYSSNHTLPEPDDIEICRGLRIYRLEPALVNATPEFYLNNSDDARRLLLQIVDRGLNVERIVSGDNLSGIGRLIGALEATGDEHSAQALRAGMRRAGRTLRICNPFSGQFGWKRPISP